MNDLDTHYAEAPTQRHARIPDKAACGYVIIANNWTSVHEHVTCVVCCLALVAFFQNAQSLLLRTIAARIAVNNAAAPAGSIGTAIPAAVTNATELKVGARRAECSCGLPDDASTSHAAWCPRRYEISK